MVSGKTSLDFSYSETTLKGSVSPGFDTSDNMSNFTVTASGGYFVFDGFAPDLQVSFTSQEDKADNRLSQFTVMPGAMYYPLNKGIVRPFVQAGIGYVNVSIKTPLDTGGKYTQSYNGWTWGGGLGASFFVKEHISIDLAAQYVAIKTSYSGDSSQKMNIDGFAGVVGFSLYF